MQRAFGKIAGNWVIGGFVVAAAAMGIVAVLWLDTTGESGSGLSKEFDFDLTGLARVDPNLVLYTQAGPPVKTGFHQSRAIALDAAGRLYVAGDSAVRILNNAGDPQRVIDLAGEPRCVTVSDDSRVYVGLKDHVEVFDAQGQRVASWNSLGEGTVLTSVAKHQNNVFVADAGHRVVLHYDAVGTLIKRIGEKNSDRNIPGFIIPSPYFDVAVSRDGLLRVVNPGRHRIEAYTFDGDLEFWWGRSSVEIDGFCGCCNPVNFALLPNGGFVTAEKGLARVKVYDSDGAFVGVVAGPDQLGKGGQVRVCDSPEQCQAGGLDVAAGAEGRVYVLDTTDNIIRIFHRKDAGQ